MLVPKSNLHSIPAKRVQDACATYVQAGLPNLANLGLFQIFLQSDWWRCIMKVQAQPGGLAQLQRRTYLHDLARLAVRSVQEALSAGHLVKDSASASVLVISHTLP